MPIQTDLEIRMVFNVKDYGAKGDGVTNDEVAIQRAIDAIALQGGGELFFPSGQYWTSNPVFLTSNMEITGKGAIFLKTPKSRSYTVFAGSSGNKQGYGAGPTNITAHGLKFKGIFGPTGARAVCAFALHHCEDVLVYNCHFIECSAGGHRFDLQGSRRVTIRDNVFYGIDTTDPATYYNEDIQLDNSTRGGGSFEEPGSLCFDGLPCTDILVEGNKWLPHTIASGTTYPAANPIGTHSAVEDGFHERIWFKDNYVGPGLSDLKSYVAGRIHFLSWRDAIISGNLFDGGGVEMAAIRAYPTKRVFLKTDLDRTDNVTTVLENAYVCDNIQIKNNTFRNFKCSGASSIGVVYIEATGTTSKHTNISIDDNIFYDNKWGNDPVPNNSMNLVWLNNVQDFSVSNNKAQMQRRFIFLVASSDGIIKDNIVRDSSNMVVGLDTCTDVDVIDNKISGATGTPCIIATKGSRVKVNSNTIKTTSPSVTGVRFADGHLDGSAVNNTLIGEGVPMDRGINAQAGTIVRVVKNNNTYNVTSPTFADRTSSITVNTGNDAF